MFKQKSLAEILAYIQLACSVLLATSIIWGYVQFRSTVGQFSQALATTIISTAKVIEQTAETVQTKQDLLDHALATLVSSRKIVEALRVSAQNQIQYAPKYAEGFRVASGVVTATGHTFARLGDNLMFSAPTSIQLEGIKPVVVMGKPLEKSGISIKASAEELSTLGSSLLAISSSLAYDSKNISAAIIETSDRSIALLSETERALTSLQKQELPRAIADLGRASENLRSASTQIDAAGSVGVTLLIAGLLLSVWCFLNSLNVLHLMANRSIPSMLKHECNIHKNHN